MSNLDRFRQDFIHANSWEQRKDGVPLYLLDKLTPSERTVAEKELIRMLSPGDTWAIMGLGHLKSPSALPALQQLLGKTRKNIKITLAHAIYQISQDPAMIDIVLEETPKLTEWTSLIDLMYLLPDFKDERVTAMLYQFRDHDDYLVAYNATQALKLPTEEVVVKFRNKKIAENQARLAAQAEAPKENLTREKRSWWQRLFE